MRLLFLFLLLFSINLRINAQEPSHFILGEDELAGVSIYDLFQDSNNNYWIATNLGIYKYDGYNISKIECKGMTSSSVFNLKEDYNHNIYCNNLSGQIFQIKHDTCIVYYTIPDKLMSSRISFDFDNQNTLILSTHTIFQVKSDTHHQLIEDNNLSKSAYLFRKRDSSLILYDLSNHKLYTIKNGKTITENLKINDLTQPVFMYFQDDLVVYDGRSKKIIEELSENLSFELPININNNKLTNYYSDNNRIWMANLSGGITIHQPNQVDQKPFFMQTIVSAFLKDKEGNILLGTFGEGIIVISNINFKNISFSDKITQISTNHKKDVFFGTQSGKIFKLDSLGNYHQIVSDGIQRIEILEYLEGQNSLIINSNQGNLVDLKDNTHSSVIKASVKDVYQIDKNNYLLATSFGVLKYHIEGTQKPEPITSLKGRAYSVGYDQSSKTIYCGTAVGLKLKTTKHTFLYKHKGKPIYCRDILALNDTIYITTKNRGVLVFTNNKVVDEWNVDKGLISNNTKFIKSYHNAIFISTDLGLNILDRQGQVLKTINKSHGLNSNNIIDFEIVDHIIWILTNKGVQNINLKHLKTKKYQPSVRIKSLKVNDNITSLQTKQYNHNQNKFVFDIDAKSLKYQNDIYYLYQLEGLDKEWIKADYENHIINYKSLPPNSYKFKIKAIYKNEESPLVEYAFKITNPFWKRWWFYALVTLVLLLSSFIFFKSKINKQKQEAKIQHQLDTIQLKALKSQMNPHFIFNSLNSIQELILQQDKEKAYNYISKFALLVRKILHHSDKEYIDFEDEVNILTVYLELEQLRFKKGFNFNIKSNDIPDIEIPPMLIQPFVENALKHGLLHKKGEKTLSINFVLKDDTLYCTIIDNGVGRKKSTEIKNRQNKQHQSFSVESMNIRFEILKNIYGDHIGVTFVDLYDNNEAIGTKVILKIPVNRKF